jgi:quercetin dioxygenase-like cupin family protein
MTGTKPITKQSDSVKAQPVERAHKTHIQILLGPDEQMPNFYMRKFTIDPGGSIPLHRHDVLEHEQMVLEGEMVITLNGQQTMVKAGDVLYIPAKAAHDYKNQSSLPVSFLCMVPAITDYQTEWL